MRYCPWTTKLVPQRAHWLVFSYFSIFESRSPQYYFSINTTSFNLFEPHYLKTQFSSNSTIHSLNKIFLYVNPYFLPYFHYFIAAYSSKNLYYKIHYFLTTHSFFFFFLNHYWKTQWSSNITFNSVKFPFCHGLNFFLYIF